MIAWLASVEPVVLALLAFVALPVACGTLVVIGLIVWLLRDFEPQHDEGGDPGPAPDEGEPAPDPEPSVDLDLTKAA